MEKETKELLKSRYDGSVESLRDTVIYGIQEKKGEKVLSIDLREIENAVAKYFIICQASSTTQVDSIADSVIDEVKQITGFSAWHIEGRKNAEWVLIDYSDVVVHIFLQDVRNFYKLEELWADAKFEFFHD
ncbi:MAG: ribosome silencing factor [Bacteroidales bacterium]